MTIKALAAIENGKPLEAFEYEPGELRPDEVEIAVEYCGVCHSDLSMLDNEWQMTQYPLVLGHEVIGEKSIGGSPTGSPQAISKMLDFAGRHSIAPMVEEFPMSKVNDAMEKLRNGSPRYRLVLKNDF